MNVIIAISYWITLACVLVLWYLYFFYLPKVQIAEYRDSVREHWDTFIENTRLDRQSKTFRLACYFASLMCSSGEAQSTLTFTLYDFVMKDNQKTANGQFHVALKTQLKQEDANIRSEVEALVAKINGDFLRLGRSRSLTGMWFFRTNIAKNRWSNITNSKLNVPTLDELANVDEPGAEEARAADDAKQLIAA